KTPASSRDGTLVGPPPRHFRSRRSAMKTSRFRRHHTPAGESSWLFAAALGAGLMYLFDPQQGRRRRALLRDQWVHLRRLAREGARVTAHDVAGRSAGMVAVVSRRLNGNSQEDVPDTALVDRVRAKLGRVVSHPHAVHVTA